MRICLLFLSAAILVLSPGCGKKSSESRRGFEGLPQFQPLSGSEEARVGEAVDWISAGAVPRSGLISIRFRHPRVATGEVGMVLEEDWVEFKPKLKGRLSWKDPQTLIFEPAEPLVPGQPYLGRLFLEKALEEKGWPSVPFAFYGQPTQWSWQPHALEERGGKSDFNFQLRFAPAPDSQAVGKFVTAEQKGGSLPVHCGMDKVEGEEAVYQCRIAAVKRGPKHPLRLRFAAKAVGAFEDADDEIALPAEGAFEVLDARPWFDGDERGFAVVFTGNLPAAPEIRPFLELDGKPAAAVRIDGPRLRVGAQLSAGSHHTLVLVRGLYGRNGKGLEKNFTLSARFPDEKPYVRLPQRGEIIPTQGQASLAFESMNLSAIRIRVVRVPETRASHYLEENGFSGYGLPQRRFGETLVNRVYQTGARKNAVHQGTIDLGMLLAKHGSGIYGLEIAGEREGMFFPCDDKESRQAGGSREEEDGYHDDEDAGNWPWNHPCNPHYFSHRSQHKILLVTDLMLFASRDPEGEVRVHSLDLVEARPWKSVKVKALDEAGAELGSGETDGNGALTLVGMAGASILAAEAAGRGNSVHRAWLRLNENEARNLSRFDVSGEEPPRGLKIFPYRDRGVYRPGDSIFVGCLVRDGAHQPFPKLPVRLTLVDPAGRVASQTVLRNAPDAHYQWRTRTRPEDLTGRWILRAEAGPASVERAFNVETVRPNRLKIKLDLPETMVRSSDLRRELTLESRWLMGTPVSGYQARVELRLTAEPVRFKTHRDFRFEDPTRSDWSKSVDPLFEGALDAGGRARFGSGLRGLEKAPGMLRGEWRTQVFERGGQPSVDFRSVAVSPFTHYIGVKLEGLNDWGSATAGKPLRIQTVALDEGGNPDADRPVTVQVWHNPTWWWYEGRSASRFQERSESRQVATLNARSGSPAEFVPERSGTYLFLATDDRGGHAAGAFSEVWSYGGGGSEGPAPTLLRVQSEDDTVTVGENVAVRFPTPDSGRVLVRVLRGRRVLREEWMEAKGGAAHWKTRVEPSFAPNVYVEVNLFQPWSRDNDRPTRMFGIVPVQVLDPATRLRLDLTAGDALLPESKARIVIRNPDKREGMVTLAVVDEGLLDLTRFKTPDPHAALYVREGLGIRTWDLQDRVLGAFSGRLSQVLTLGGDAVDLDELAKKSGLEFPPMVWVSRPLPLEGKAVTVEVPIPAYAGSVRIMAVGSAGEAAGFAEKAVPVRAPVMVFGAVPRALSPGDRCELPATLFAFKAGDARVQLNIEGSVTHSGPRSASTRMGNQGGEFLAFFPIFARGLPGTAKAEFIAEGPGGKARQALPLEIRWPEPPRTVSEEHTVGPEGLKFEWKPFGLEGTRKNTLSIGSLSLGLQWRIDELIRYPHGCVEQTVSAALPQLLLPRLFPDLEADSRENARRHVGEAIEKLARFQTPGGGFSMWHGDAQPWEWGTLWAAVFLQQAKKEGFPLPQALDRPLFRHLAQAAREFHPGVYARSGDTLGQATRLLLLAREGNPQWGSMNLLREARLPAAACWTLARAYAAAGRGGDANNLAGRCTEKVTSRRSLWGYLESPSRDLALILSAQAELGRKPEAQRLFTELRRQFVKSDNWYSTQEQASLLLAFADFLGKSGGGAAKFEARWRLGGGEWKAVSGQGRKFKLPENAEGLLEVEVSQGGPVDVFLSRTGVATEAPAMAQGGVGLKVEWLDAAGQAVQPDRLSQGAQIYAKITVANKNDYALENLALTFAVPGGWEIRNPRLQGGPGLTGLAQPRYLDVRDDRIHAYFSLDRRQESSFAFGVGAAYRGEYHRPGVLVEAMYDAGYSAYEPGGRAMVAAE